MIKKMLVNATHPEENRVAIVEDGILSELDIEISGKEQTKGNIYKASVIRVEQGLQAAFVDYGAERLGFLQLGELHPGLFPKRDGDGKSRPRIHDILHRGQELLVQIVKEERGQKGAALTTFLSLPGRYMVLMPQDKTRGMSRKIPDGSERKQLKAALAGLELPEEIGYIIRTAAIGQPPEELKRDLDYLLRVYNNITDHSRKVKAPALIYRESNLVIRSIRDYFTPDMDEVLVDDPKFVQEARDFFQQVMPEYVNLVKLHQERRPIFSRYQIEDQIETISHKQVALPSGGSIVIDTTEALVAIDVNSGKMASEQGVEGTAYKTNLEAAEEAARQLRLRDLGGLVVIDFIDMRDRKHIREVEKRLKDALAKDKARVSVGRISQFGLLEMSRQRIKAALAEGSFLNCPNCKGTGRVKSSEAQAVAFLRKLQATAARGQIERIEGEVPIDVAHYLLNDKREELSEMERKYQLSIFVRARKSFIASQFELITHKREKDDRKLDELNAPVTAASGLFEPPARLEPAESRPAPEPTAAVETAEPGEAAPAKSSRSRRRRRKGSKQAAAETEAAAATAEPAVETAALAEAVTEQAQTDLPEAAQTEPAVAVETAEPGEATPAKSGRSRRRRRRSKGAQTAAEAGAPEEAAKTAAAPPAAAQPEPATIESAQPETPPAAPAAKKPRRGRRKTSAAAGTPQPTEQAPADTAPAAEPKPAAMKPEPPKPETVQPSAAEPAAAPAEAAKPEAAKPEAAKAPRSPRRSPKTKTPAVAQEAEAVGNASDQPQAAARPQTDTPPAPPVKEAAAETPATEATAKKPAQKPARPRSKKAAEAVPTKAVAVQAAEDKPAEKKKPARKPAAKKAAATKTEADDRDKPAPKRRTRTTAAKSKSGDTENAEK